MKSADDVLYVFGGGLRWVFVSRSLFGFLIFKLGGWVERGIVSLRGCI